MPILAGAAAAATDQAVVAEGEHTGTVDLPNNIYLLRNTLL